MAQHVLRNRSGNADQSLATKSRRAGAGCHAGSQSLSALNGIPGDPQIMRDLSPAVRWKPEASADGEALFPRLQTECWRTGRERHDTHWSCPSQWDRVFDRYEVVRARTRSWHARSQADGRPPALEAGAEKPDRALRHRRSRAWLVPSAFDGCASIRCNAMAGCLVEQMQPGGSNEQRQCRPSGDLAVPAAPHGDGRACVGAQVPICDCVIA